MRFPHSLAFLAVPGFAALGFAQKSPNHDLLIGLRKGANASRACAPVGKVLGQDPYSRMWIVTLRVGVTPAGATKQLESNEDVRFVLPESARWVNQTSYVSVDNHLRYLDDAEALAEGSSEGSEGPNLVTRHPSRPTGDPEKREPLTPLDRREIPSIGNPSAKGDKNDFYEALRYYLRSRVNKQGYVDFNAIKAGFAHRKAMPVGRIRQATTSSGITPMTATGTWSFIGPNNLTIPYNLYYGTPPLSGRVSAIAYDPTTSSTIYVGGGGGGLWKTTNGGSTWACISDTPSWQYEAVDSIAIDPKNHNIIYVGTGDFDGFFAGYNQGVMKSTDGGATWANVTPNIQGISNLAVSHIIVDPDNDQIVTITTGRGSYGGPNASQGGIWRSTNAGDSWTEATGIAASDYCTLDVSLPSGGSRTYWAGGAGTPALLYESRNQGATWTQVTSLPSSAAETQWTLACSKVSPGSLYILFPGVQKLYKSTSGGSSWTNVTTVTFPNGYSQSPYYNWSQSTYDYFLGTVASSQASAGEILFCGLITVAFSTDGGTTWADYGETYGGTNSNMAAVMHNDQHQFASSPTDATQILIGNDGGLSRVNLTWSSGKPAFTLQQLNAGLGITQFYGIAPHPTDSTKILGGTQDNASPASLGDLNNWLNPGQGDGGACAWDIPESCFITTSDGGAVEEYSLTGTDEATLSQGFSTGGFIMPTVVSDDGSKILLGTTDLEVYDFTTPSAGFTDMGVDLTGDSSQVVSNYLQTVATAPGDENRVYTGSTSGAIFMSTDLGKAYKRLDNSTLPQAVVGGIAANPTNENDVLAGYQSLGDNIHHLWRCTDVTATTPSWVSVSGSGTTGLPDVPVNAIVFDPSTPNTTWYVGTDVGVFMTTNSGSTWSNVSTGLPITQVFDLKYGNGYLYAGTFGRGIYRIALSSSGGGGQGGTQAGAPWPKFRANVVNGGVSAAGADAIPAVKWAYNIGRGQASFSSAAIAADGSLYVGADNGEIYALASSTGALKWAHVLNGEIASSPLIGADGTVYVGTLGGTLYAFAPSNGAIKWSLSLGAMYSSPTINSNGTIYVGAGDDLFAVNPSTGAKLWSCPTSGQVQSSPAIGANGTIYVGSSDRHLYAVDASSGKVDWARLAGGAVTASPAVGSDGTVYFGDGAGDLYALNPADGSVKWARSAAAMTGSPAIGSDGTIYFGCNNDRLYAFSSTGALKWTAILNGTLTSSPALAADGTLYIGSGDKHLYAVNSSNGTVKWTMPTGGAVNTSPAIDANGVVYVGSDDGYFFATNGSAAVTKVYASPWYVTGGKSTTGYVSVSGASPGMLISLSSNSSSVKVPSTVAASGYGSSTASFTITTSSVSTFVDGTITATLGSTSATGPVVVSPSTVFSNFYTLPSAVVGGSSATGVIQTYAPAPSGGLVISLKAGTSYLTVPASVTMPAGKTGVSFSITSSPVAAPTYVTLLATSGSNSVWIHVPIEPYPITNFSASPSSVVGGTTTFGYLTIAGKAVSPGEVITLASSDSHVTVPSSVTVPTGSTTCNFPIKTSAVSANTNVAITATIGTSSSTATLALQP